MTTTIAESQTFTITEGSVAITKTFTIAQWNAAKSTGQLLNFDHQFASGTHINFDVDFDVIDDVPDTAGVGTSVIEKNVNIAVSSTNLNGVGQRIERSALNQSGQQKLANGEKASAPEVEQASAGEKQETLDLPL
jgi:hypothetical protein